MCDPAAAIERAQANTCSLARFPDENPNPVLRVARDGRLLYANQSSRHLLQCWHCEQSARFMPEGERRRITETLTRAANQHQEVTCGEVTYWLALAPIPEMDYVNIYERDITARKRMEEELRASREQLRALAAWLAEAGEAERRRLSRELHDGVGQNLTALGISLSVARGEVAAGAAAQAGAKHARARRVTLTLETAEGTSRLIIAADGAGFDPQAPHPPGEPQGWGLLSMRERAEAVGGTLTVESAPRQGTRVTVTVW